MTATSVEILAPAVRRLRAGNPGLMTGSGTNSYLLGDRDVAVLDPGPNDPRHLQNLIAAAPGPIRWVIVTHTHGDHSPLAAALARETGARLIGLPPPGDGRQDETFNPDERPGDGVTLVLGDLRLIAVHTPGHASNCVCYLQPDAAMLFTGDHVLGGVSPVILPPDGDMGAYLNSLDKLQAYDFERIAPGHGDVMEHGKAVITQLRAHRIAREDKVLRCLAGGAAAGSSIDELTPSVYDDVPADRHAWAKFTLRAHLIKLVREDRVREHNGVYRVLHG